MFCCLVQLGARSKLTTIALPGLSPLSVTHKSAVHSALCATLWTRFEICGRHNRPMVKALQRLFNLHMADQDIGDLFVLEVLFKTKLVRNTVALGNIVSLAKMPFWVN